MKILLLNVDSEFNIAIRRMFRFYQMQGHGVDMIDLNLSGYPHKKTKIIDASEYDRVFVSNIFDRNAYNVIVENCDRVEYGGIGSRNPSLKLPDEIERVNPFYFPDEDTAHGFITRGCIRNCWFCKVPKYEGKLFAYNSVERVVGDFKKAKFYDNNILAYPNHMDVFEWLIEHGIKCNFNQGLDFRLVTPENLDALSRMKYARRYIFAFDDPKYQKIIDRKMELIQQYLSNPWQTEWYIYYHPDMPLTELKQRVEWCRDHLAHPYLMRDAACWDSPQRDFITTYTAYCNQAAFFKKMDFEQFCEKRHENNHVRRDSCIATYRSIG